MREQETITCDGCGREINVTREVGTPLIVERGEGADTTVTIRIGRDEVHRCTRDSDRTSG